jgi:hypothetical protein
MSMWRKNLPVALVMAASVFAACISTQAEAAGTVIVMQDQAALRAAPRDSAAALTTLWRGEALEVRGEKMDYLQVWDHHRERGGFVRKSQLHTIGSSAADAPALLHTLRFVANTPGAEALGIGLAAAYIQAAPAAQLASADGATALDTMARLAQQLADRLASVNPQRTTEQTALTAQLDVATRYGLRFVSREADGRVTMCLDGELWRRVMALPASPEQQARAALALTRADCLDPTAADREKLEQWRADVLARVDTTALPPTWKNRVQLRRAAVWSSLAFAQARAAQARKGANTASDSTQKALAAFALVDKNELADEDQPRYNEAAMRVNAMRWAAPAAAAVAAKALPAALTLAANTETDGQTCLSLHDTRHANATVKRCTWGLVWLASASSNREGTAVSVAVTPTDGWRELWVFHKTDKADKNDKNDKGAGAWSVQVLPPAAAKPELGYAEHAGWVPGGQQMLVAREALAEGRYKRNYEVVAIHTLNTERQASDAKLLGAFQRWSDAAWLRDSPSQR